MFVYCLNNPINYYDPTGAQPAWADMGFEYDGSMGDFRRLENGLPPLAYENWLRSQEKKNVDIVISTIDHATYKVTGLTNMTADMVYKQYQSMVDKHDQYDFTKIPTYLMVLGIGAYWGTLAAVAIDIVLMGSDMMEKTDIQMFKRMAESNQSVLIVVWEVSGDSMPTRTMNAYYIWDEESLPFWG